MGPSRSPGIGIKPATAQKSIPVTPGIKSSQDVLKLFDTKDNGEEEYAVSSPQQPPPTNNRYNPRSVFSQKNTPVTPKASAACGETVK